MNTNIKQFNFQRATALVQELKSTANTSAWDEAFLTINKDYDAILFKESDYIEKQIDKEGSANKWVKIKQYNLNVFYHFRQLVNRYRKVNQHTIAAKDAEIEHLKDRLVYAYRHRIELHKNLVTFIQLEEAGRNQSEFWHNMAFDLIKENNQLRNQLKSQ